MVRMTSGDRFLPKASRNVEMKMDARLLFWGMRSGRSGVDGDDNRFGCGRIALVCHAVDGDEYVGFGKICCHVGSGNGVGDDHEVSGSSCSALVMAH